MKRQFVNMLRLPKHSWIRVLDTRSRKSCSLGRLLQSSAAFRSQTKASYIMIPPFGSTQRLLTNPMRRLSCSLKRFAGIQSQSTIANPPPRIRKPLLLHSCPISWLVLPSTMTSLIPILVAKPLIQSSQTNNTVFQRYNSLQSM